MTARRDHTLAMSSRQSRLALSSGASQRPPLFDPAPGQTTDAQEVVQTLRDDDGVKLAVAATSAGVALLLALTVSGVTNRARPSIPEFDELGDFPASVVCRQPFGDISCGPVS